MPCDDAFYSISILQSRPSGQSCLCISDKCFALHKQDYIADIKEIVKMKTICCCLAAIFTVLLFSACVDSAEGKLAESLQGQWTYEKTGEFL